MMVRENEVVSQGKVRESQGYFETTMSGDPVAVKLQIEGFS